MSIKSALEGLKASGFIEFCEWHDKQIEFVGGPSLVRMAKGEEHESYSTEAQARKLPKSGKMRGNSGLF